MRPLRWYWRRLVVWKEKRGWLREPILRGLLRENRRQAAALRHAMATFNRRTEELKRNKAR